MRRSVGGAYAPAELAAAGMASESLGDCCTFPLAAFWTEVETRPEGIVLSRGEGSSVARGSRLCVQGFAKARDDRRA